MPSKAPDFYARRSRIAGEPSQTLRGPNPAEAAQSVCWSHGEVAVNRKSRLSACRPSHLDRKSSAVVAHPAKVAPSGSFACAFFRSNETTAIFGERTNRKPASLADIRTFISSFSTMPWVRAPAESKKQSSRPPHAVRQDAPHDKDAGSGQARTPLEHAEGRSSRTMPSQRGDDRVRTGGCSRRTARQRRPRPLRRKRGPGASR